MPALLVWLVVGLVCATFGTERAGEDTEISGAELGLMMALYLVFWPLVLLCRVALMLDEALEVWRK